MTALRFSDESTFAIANEKCTIAHPRVTENPQIPISAIAVNKRMSARIATGQIVLLPSSLRLIAELQSRALGLSYTRPEQRHERDGDSLHL